MDTRLSQSSTPELSADDQRCLDSFTASAVTFLKDPYAELRLGVPEWVHRRPSIAELDDWIVNMRTLIADQHMKLMCLASLSEKRRERLEASNESDGDSDTESESESEGEDNTGPTG